MITFARNQRKVFYEYLTRKGIGPTGDYIDPGVYWVKKYIPALEVQADRIWILLADGSLREVRPDSGFATEETLSWLELRATYLRWFE